ncbi:bifunctional riboflavin kinase/FAD synthetase [Deltaproteobacteria bacterium TL4]
MKIFNFRENMSPATPTVVTIGNFDGVHLGHQKLISTVVNEARHRQCTSALITFDPHPQEVLRPDHFLPKICSQEQLVAQLEATGLDSVHIIPFTVEFSKLSPEEFALKFLIERFNLAKLVIGHDFHFGKNREGNVVFLEKMSQDYGFDLEEVQAFQIQGKTVSSTEIRNLIKAFDFDSIEPYLGRRYSLLGQVKRGDQRGRQLGFPTANLYPRIHLPLPQGVYVTQLKVQEQIYFGVTNVGRVPTFEKNVTSIETYLFDFDRDIYEATLEIWPLHYLRPEKKFESVSALKQQIQADVEQAKAYLVQKQAFYV